MTAFRVVVPVYKAGPWIRRCVESIRSQRHEDFSCIVIDDQSPDGTYERAVEAAQGDERFTIERSPERRRPLGNIVAGIRQITAQEDGADEDVIVNVDGDDWLAHENVFSLLDGIYADPAVWLTYGSHRRWKNKLLHRIGWKKRRGIARAYPDAIVRNRFFRQHEFTASHLRTFRKFLWDAIEDDDLRDEQGRYFTMAGDLAFMFPMLEMAGADHIRFIEEMLYVYNNSNPISEHRAAADDQLLAAANIRRKPVYAPLER